MPKFVPEELAQEVIEHFSCCRYDLSGTCKIMPKCQKRLVFGYEHLPQGAVRVASFVEFVTQSFHGQSQDVAL